MTIELTSPNTVIENLPELQVIHCPEVSGVIYDENGEAQGNVHYPVDQGYKVAGHLSDGAFYAISNMKSENYHEMSHTKTLESIFGNLENRGLQFGVWKQKLVRGFGIMTTDVLFKEQYKINEDCFEDALGVVYADGQDVNARGVYQPMLRITNSFYGASYLEFMIARILCENGQISIADNATICFSHVSDIVMDFERRSDAFLDNIFAGNTIENIMLNLTKTPIALEAFIGWLANYGGPRAVNQVIDQFNLESESYLDGGPCNMNAWVVYNMMTWLTSNRITHAVKQRRLHANFNRLLEAA